MSGGGLATLYRALIEIEGADAPGLEAGDIVDGAKSGTCPRCLETINIFCSVLGSFAGDTALTMSSQGGVYIGGGIAPRIAEVLEDSPFRERFESKGRMSSFIRHVPTYLVTADHAALAGAASLLLSDLRS